MCEQTSNFGLPSLPTAFLEIIPVILDCRASQPPFLDWAAAGADHTSYFGPPGDGGEQTSYFGPPEGGGKQTSYFGSPVGWGDHTSYFGPPVGVGEQTSYF